MSKRLNIAVAGCGNISGPYGTCIRNQPDVLSLIGCFDPLPDRMQEFATKFECKPYESLDAMLEDTDVDLVVNLTNDRPHRCTGSQAYHILDVCVSILESARVGRPIEVKSRFTPPAPVIE
jgi:predicted dehydrogenase